MFAQYFVLIVLSTFTLTLANDDPSSEGSCGRILKINDRYEFVTVSTSAYEELTTGDDALAFGCWNQTYNSTGWSVLEIKTFGNHSNLEQVYAAGLLEGQLTRGWIDEEKGSSIDLVFCFVELTNLQWQNSIRDICVNQTEVCIKLKTFFSIQLDWIYDQINSYSNDEYWHQVFEEGNSF